MEIVVDNKRILIQSGNRKGAVSVQIRNEAVDPAQIILLNLNRTQVLTLATALKESSNDANQ